MLRSFRDKDTGRVWQRQPVPKPDQGTQRMALRKLLILDAADALSDLRVPPGNRLEKLRGDRADTDSIRINRQWRICFQWTGDADLANARLGSCAGETTASVGSQASTRNVRPHWGQGRERRVLVEGESDQR